MTTRCTSSVLLLSAALLFASSSVAHSRSSSSHASSFAKAVASSHASGASTWAVLAAASSGWSNYRHQADVMHAYRSLLAAGVPAERIVTMLYNDTAYNRNNNKKGKIFNEVDGPDLYPAIRDHIDYVATDVNAAVFLNVITGQPTKHGSGRVLHSGPEDNVFVYFDDHGGPGILAWAVGADLSSDELVNALWTMHDTKMYGKLVVYISACESGSLFYKSKLPPNCYVSTSAPIAASGIATNYDKNMDTYLASAWPFAVWSHSDKFAPAGRTTFQEQFDWTAWNVDNTSIPCQYGDLSIAQNTALPDFWNPAPAHSSSSRWTTAKTAGVQVPLAGERDWALDWDVPLENARRSHSRLLSTESKGELQRETEFREVVDKAAQSVIMAGTSGLGRPAACSPDHCDRSCKCMQACYDSAAACKFECCDVNSCFQLPPKATLGAAFDRSESCFTAIAGAWSSTCAPAGTRTVQRHPYLRSAHASFRWACRARTFDVDAALQALRRVCPAVSSIHYSPLE